MSVKNIVVLLVSCSFAVFGGQVQASSTVYGTTVQGCIEGNGIASQQTRVLSDFNRLSVSGAFEVRVVSNQAQTLTISGDENILDHITTTVKDDTLGVYPDRSICPKNRLLVEIAVENLEGLRVSGAMSVFLSGVDNQHLDIDLDGAAEVHASGQSQNVIAVIDGAGNLSAQDLESDHVQIRINGTGNADVHANRILDADIRGVGNIYYAGNPPQVRRQILGVGAIIPK